ncbi:hypothetical protein [Dyadobacter sp. CY326]|uniref:hypothetical protein n=1 Tax=Dyadobacter sp. CY326 TaxID=2907300 RepID=UPI001F40FA74|nr:hypothetical protein [Dyadobacter sp. CY326]MCE7065265.1 hypothetical protein [Dyadobacter sp. CY326]
MPKIDTLTCEPFRAWNRLEPRTRKDEFEDTLKCEVHDPLWMLTRQWQFGEFQGEDTGSAIFAKIKMQTTRILRYVSTNGEKESYADHIPLETKVESEFPVLDFHTKVKSAAWFMKLLKSHFAKSGIAFNHNAYLNHLKTIFPIDFPAVLADGDSHKDTVNKLYALVNEPLTSFLAGYGNQWFDGVKLNQMYKSAPPAAADPALMDPSHLALVQSAVADFNVWFSKNYQPDHNSNGKGAWLNEQMEYQFGVAFPETGKPNTVLKAEEYYNGDLEWFSFDAAAANEAIDGLSGDATPEESNLVSEKILTVIPTLAKFGGMPHPRWWQFEDGSIDLGNIDADTTDISKLIVSEYALVYGNNWLVVPYAIPVGSLTNIPAIVITDVFGQRLLIQPAVQGSSDDWNAWGMFNLSTRHSENDSNIPADTRLFLPPCVVKTQESEPLEEIRFVRDEMANMVWAIETRVDSLAGNSLEGDTAASALKNAMEVIEPPVGAIPTDEMAKYKYELENTVPENWIPFIPAHIPGQFRAIQLQRASMPRWFKNDYGAVRPVTRLLRDGIGASNDALSPMFVNEEEVPRAGAVVTSSFQRTRWYNGKVINWLGKRKRLGRGEGTSGLQFDSLETVKR